MGIKDYIASIWSGTFSEDTVKEILEGWQLAQVKNYNDIKNYFLK